MLPLEKTTAAEKNSLIWDVVVHSDSWFVFQDCKSLDFENDELNRLKKNLIMAEIDNGSFHLDWPDQRRSQKQQVVVMFGVFMNLSAIRTEES